MTVRVKVTFLYAPTTEEQDAMTTWLDSYMSAGVTEPTPLAAEGDNTFFVRTWQTQEQAEAYMDKVTELMPSVFSVSILQD